MIYFEDGDDLADQSASSVLASPLPHDSSPTHQHHHHRSFGSAMVHDDDDDEDAITASAELAALPSPIRASGHYPKGPRRLDDSHVTQSTPSGMLRHRARRAAAVARGSVSPQKRLNFEQ